MHETCKCKCRFDTSVCNNKQRWNDDKCRCNVKNRLIKVVVVNDLSGILVIVNVNVRNHVMLWKIWTMKIGNLRKKLVDKLVEECTENIDEVKMAKMTLAEHENKILLYTLHCAIFNNLYNQLWNWHFFCLLQIHESW